MGTQVDDLVRWMDAVRKKPSFKRKQTANADESTMTPLVPPNSDHQRHSQEVPSISQPQEGIL